MKIRKVFILLLIILLGFFLRFYNLGDVPAGISDDEASHGYNAYSLLLTGKDEWGKTFPIFLRESGNYPAPLYTYLSIIPIKFMGISVYSTRFISALSGTLLVLLTFLIVNRFRKNSNLAFISALLVAISPWSVFFSRTAIEANLALTLVALSFYLLLISLDRIYLFIPAAITMGLSSHAYHAERVVSFLYIVIFLYIYRKKYIKDKPWVLCGITLFFIIQLPQFLLLNEPGALKRFNLHNYLSYDFYLENGKHYHNLPFGQLIFTIREFSSQYLAYFSPRNLFFYPDSQLMRSIPDLSVYYSWMFIPFILALKGFQKIRNNPDLKMLVCFLLISPLPAAVVRDSFYTLRALPLFWGLTIVISIGIIKIVEVLNRKLKTSILQRKIYFLRKTVILRIIVLWFLFRRKIVLWFIFLGVALLSLSSLYSSYFVLFNFERSNVYGYPYQEFVELSANFPDTHYILDSQEKSPTYIWIAFYKKFDPRKIQEISAPRIKNSYYGDLPLNGRYILDNIEIRPIYWIEDVYKDQIIVGTTLAVSQEQAEGHRLTKVFQILDYSGKVYLVGYQTNPRQHCLQEAGEGILNWRCEKLLK